MKSRWWGGLAGLGLLAATPLAGAAVITFDDEFTGETSFAFDGDGDGVDDVVFSTTDPSGFNRFGPGASQEFIDEPGLEGAAELNPDLRVDFLTGATGVLSFGFALQSSVESEQYFASLEVFDAAGNLIGSGTEIGRFNNSSFPENLLEVAIEGTAAYATFNFTSEFNRYIIDNFRGTFGSTEVPVPEPASLGLLAAGLCAARLLGRRNRR